VREGLVWPLARPIRWGEAGGTGTDMKGTIELLVDAFRARRRTRADMGGRNWGGPAPVGGLRPARTTGLPGGARRRDSKPCAWGALRHCRDDKARRAGGSRELPYSHQEGL